MTFKTGDVGENWAQLMASRAGITVNPVRRDEFGWDFCLQLRREGSPAHVPLDHAPAELTCMLQVKTTRVGAESEGISLANWQRMVKDPLPWFCLAVALDPEGEVTNAYLIHVGESWIERVMKRLRQLDAEAATKLNDRTLDLTWQDVAPLAVPYPASLREGILSTVGDLTEYVARKAKFRRDVGYQRGFRHEISFTTPLSRDQDADTELLVDFAIGLTKRLPVTSFLVEDVRFNMPRVVDDKKDLSECYFEFASVPSVGPTTIRFSNKSKTRSATIVCETYIPTLLLPRLPRQHFKARFVSDIITIVTSSKTNMKVSWSFQDHSPIALSTLAQASAAIVLFEHASADDPVSLRCERDDLPPADIGYANCPIEIPAEVRELATVARYANVVAHYFGLPQDTKTTAERLRAQANQLTVMNAFLDPSVGPITLGVKVDDTEKDWSGRPVSIVIPVSARIGDHVVAAAVSFAGPAQWDKESARVNVNDGVIKFLEKWSVPVAEWASFGFRSKALAGAEALSQDPAANFDTVFGPDDDAF